MEIIYVKSRKINNVKFASNSELTDTQKSTVIKETEELQKSGAHVKVVQMIREREDICKRILNEKTRIKVWKAPLVIELPRIRVKFIVKSDGTNTQNSNEE